MNISLKTLQIAVRSIVQEEDRSKNLMVLGLNEERGEKVLTLSVEF